MQEIATRTGGRYFEAKKKDSLEDIYNQIAERIAGTVLAELHARQARRR